MFVSRSKFYWYGLSGPLSLAGLAWHNGDTPNTVDEREGTWKVYGVCDELEGRGWTAWVAPRMAGFWGGDTASGGKYSSDSPLFPFSDLSQGLSPARVALILCIIVALVSLFSFQQDIDVVSQFALHPVRVKMLHPR